LGLLLRGEVVWWKGRAAGGSCAWGTFQQPGNPVLRDITERIVIASKGRFDRALGPKERDRLGLPSTATIGRDEFLEATTDLWDMPPESATRVGHPAPFPVELPQRLLELYTYQADTILDPFLGSGTTAVAAVRTRRHFIGYDNDPSYVRLARQRVQAELERGRHQCLDIAVCPPGRADVEDRSAAAMSAGAYGAAGSDGALERALCAGSQAKEVAGILLTDSGFTRVRRGVRLPGTGVEISFLATDAAGEEWAFELPGSFSSGRTGLRRSDVLWRSLGKAAVLHAHRPGRPFILLTTDLPGRGSAAWAALEQVKGAGRPVRDVIEVLDPGARERLHTYAGRGNGSDIE
jgi:site-specific DNA-methyltransferase (adenine-specific)